MSETALRKSIAQRSLGRCEIPGCTRRADSVHHRLKRGQGGPWSLANCLHVCGTGTSGCHGRIESNPTLAKVLGYWLTPTEVPEDVPCWLSQQGWRAWWLLGDESTWVDRDAPSRELWDRAA